MEYQKLKTLISEQIGTDEEVATWCNTPSVNITIESFQTTRSLMANLGATESNAFLSELETAAQSVPIVNRILTLLSPSEGGIDIGLDEVQVQLDQLVAGGLVTSTLAEKVKALSVKEVSPATSVGLPKVYSGDVKYARSLQ